MKWIIRVTDTVGKSRLHYLVEAKSANDARRKVIQYFGESASLCKFMVEGRIESEEELK